MVNIDNYPLEVELAVTDEDKKQGLSERRDISFSEGMLFVYDKSGYPTIWMKDMNFPIDIIWLSKEKEVVDFKTEVSPETYPDSFSPKKPAIYVLETKAGFIKKHNIKVGDKVYFEL